MDGNEHIALFLLFFFSTAIYRCSDTTKEVSTIGPAEGFVICKYPSSNPA